MKIRKVGLTYLAIFKTSQTHPEPPGKISVCGGNNQLDAINLRLKSNLNAITWSLGLVTSSGCNLALLWRQAEFN